MPFAVGVTIIVVVLLCLLMATMYCAGRADEAREWEKKYPDGR